MAQGLITYNTKVENGGATVDGKVLAADLNEIKSIVNQNSADAEGRVASLEGSSVAGPGSATDTAIALFDLTTGKLLKNSVVLVDASGNVTGIDDLLANTLRMTEGAAASTPAAGTGVIYTKATDSRLYYKDDSGTEFDLLATASGDVAGPASATDNALARYDATSGKVIQDSLGILDDTGNLSGLLNLSTGNTGSQQRSALR
jgi:hypothetical protein